MQIEKSASDSYLYEDVSNLIVSMIESGTLKPGDKVPSLRKMSRRLNISIATVSQAYINLEERGLLTVRPQSGFYVRHAKRIADTPTHPAPARQPRKLNLSRDIASLVRISRQKGMISLGVANPATELLPYKALSRTIRKISSKNPQSIIAYGPPGGEPELRRLIAQRFSESGKSVTAEDVLMTNGATEALLVSLQAVAKPGDLVAVATPSYFRTLQMIESLGNLVVEIETDVNTGISLDSLARALSRHDIKTLILQGNFSNPTGSLMPADNKKALVELLAYRNIPLIEDDVNNDLYFTRNKPPSCKTYDREGLVLHCSSFSKTLAPGFRCGWVIGGKFNDKVRNLQQLSSLATPSLQQLAIAEFLSGGQYDRYMGRIRQIYKQQLETMRQAIANDFPSGTRISSPQGGITLWIQLPRGINTIELYYRAVEENISFTPGPLFSATKKYTNYLRICAGTLWSSEIRMAVQKLGQLISDMLENRSRNGR